MTVTDLRRVTAGRTPAEITATAFREVTVVQARWEAEGVVSLSLADPDGRELPAWTPGAHVDLRLPSGAVRQYSLCGDPADRRTYLIAVARDPGGKGGSIEIHDTALVGKRLEVRGPRNHFPLRDAASGTGYLLIAGGIGVTPLLPMARQLASETRSFRMVYCGRTAAGMPFRDKVAQLAGPEAVVATGEQGRPDLAALLDDTAPGTEVYCCGPAGLMAEIGELCGERGLSLHIERFGPAAADSARESHLATRTADGAAAMPGLPAGASADGSFEVELARRGTIVTVPCGRSILGILREHGEDVVSSCEEGFCGACETRVLAGLPDHRDDVLGDAERESGETMMICVSRARSDRLVLDL